MNLNYTAKVTTWQYRKNFPKRVYCHPLYICRITAKHQHFCRYKTCICIKHIIVHLFRSANNTFYYQHWRDRTLFTGGLHESPIRFFVYKVLPMTLWQTNHEIVVSTEHHSKSPTDELGSVNFGQEFFSQLAFIGWKSTSTFVANVNFNIHFSTLTSRSHEWTVQPVVRYNVD